MGMKTVYVDDLTDQEGEDVETRRYSIGRKSYEIDLSAKNYEQFLKDMDKYTSKSREVTKPQTAPRSVRRAGSGSAASDKGYTPAQVREWAAKEGIEVSPRGRIHGDVIQKYEYAMGLDKS